MVRWLKMPFRDAHHRAGQLVAMAEKKGVALAELTLADMQGVEPGITRDVFRVLEVKDAIASRTSLGGTAPKRVRAEIQRWKRRLKTRGRS
jgi:argininosuccinate lyase